MFDDNQEDSNPTAEEAVDTDPAFSTAAVGHNRRIRVQDLKFAPGISERRHFSEDDLARARVQAGNRDCWRPVPVVEKEDHLCAIDSFVFLHALVEIDPEAEVEVTFVSDAEALRLRNADHQPRSGREKMAPSRRAMLLYEAGWQHQRIADLLGVKVPRVSQMIGEARTEERYQQLAGLIQDPHATPARFWQDVYATRAARERADEAKPVVSGPTRVEVFDAKIAALVANKKTVSVDELRKALGLNQPRTKAPGRRARMIGDPVTVPGEKIEIRAARKRQGGPIINFPPGYPPEDFDEALSFVLKLLGRQTRRRRRRGQQPDSN